MPNFWRTGAPRILKIQWFPLSILIFGHFWPKILLFRTHHLKNSTTELISAYDYRLWCRFGCGSLKMVGPKKQDFWPKSIYSKETIEFWEYGERQFVKIWAWLLKINWFKNWSQRKIFKIVKVWFRHFLTNHNSSQDCFKTISFEHVHS